MAEELSGLVPGIFVEFGECNLALTWIKSLYTGKAFFIECTGGNSAIRQCYFVAFSRNRIICFIYKFYLDPGFFFLLVCLAVPRAGFYIVSVR